MRKRMFVCALTDVPQITNGSIAQLVDQLGSAHLKRGLDCSKDKSTADGVGHYCQTQTHIGDEKGEELAKADPTF